MLARSLGGKSKQVGKDDLKEFLKVIPAKGLFPNGEEPVAIDIYERLGDFAFSFGIFATKAYIALALI